MVTSARTCAAREFANALLDPVKAFERIPHNVVVHHAKLLGYNVFDNRGCTTVSFPYRFAHSHSSVGRGR